jgi:hypothetical protein
MISSLQKRPEKANCAPRKRRPKGWTPERRAQQAARIRVWQPWRRSTGPRSEAGKAQSAMNALKHGGRSRAHIMQMRRVRNALRLAARNIAILRTHIRVTRLEHTLALEPQTPAAISKLQALRDVLASLTNGVPCPPKPWRRRAPEKIAKTNEQTDADRNPPKQPSTCQGADPRSVSLMLLSRTGVNFRSAERRSQLGIHRP